jgi:hypothetical protein
MKSRRFFFQTLIGWVTVNRCFRRDGMKFKVELKYLKKDVNEVKREIIQRLDDLGGWVEVTFLEE